MAKQKLTVEQIRALYQKLNPLKFGPNANPIVPKLTKFTLIGKIGQDAQGNKVSKWVDVTKLSEEAKKANPGLTITRYMRIMKTDDVPEVMKPGDVLRTARRPLADNLFERSQPMLYEQLVRLLKDKDEKGNFNHFITMEPDIAGNPRMKLRSPVPGCFIVLNVPGHYRLDKDGKILAGSRKDLATGKFMPNEKIVFRTDTFFLFEHEIDRLEEIALGRYQKLIEPMLSEEVKVSLDEAGNVVKKEIASAATVVDLEKPEEDETPETPGTPEQQFDEFGEPLS